jgi:8-oxo-dGTP diphosphatase
MMAGLRGMGFRLLFGRASRITICRTRIPCGASALDHWARLCQEFDVNQDRAYPSRPFLAASIAVLRAGKVLVATRTHPPMNALFTLPGGLVEPGESLAQAAVRELREEVGVEARVIGFVGPVEVIHRDEDGRVRAHFVICAHAAEWISGEGEPGPEAGDVRWVGLDDLADLPTTPGLRDIVARALAIAEDAR